MNLNYVSRFGLEFNPFIKNSKEIYFESEDSKELTYRLKYLEGIKGFGLITGNPGIGKTSIVRKWAKDLNPSLFKVIYIPLSTLTVLEFYRSLAIEFGIEPYARKNQNYKAIQESINRLALEKKITPVIILDEANHLISSILHDLKMLFNFDMDSRDRAIVLFIGLPTMNNTLNLTANEALRQRIVMNYHLEYYSKAQTKDYIISKLKAAGGSSQILDDSSFEAIANYSNGLPRVINKIINASLLLTHSLKLDTISNDIIMKAINDISLGG